MKKFTGKGVYGAIAMGKISVFQKQDTLIQRTSVKDTEAEKARVEAAKAAAAEKLQAAISFQAVQGGGRNKCSDL